jgi:radical SAM protein with 4Fe4S-binding SPASM domain
MYKNYPFKIMNWDLIKKIILECNEYHSYINKIILYMNNEPFLDNRMVDILRYVKSFGFKIEISTNASCLTKKISDAIVNEHLIDDLRISFYTAKKKDYEEYMPGLKYKNSVRNVKQFLLINKLNGNPIPTNIIMVLIEDLDMEKNIKEMKKLFDCPIRLFGYLDRAGNNKKKNILNSENKDCIYGCSLNRPNNWITILADGKVQLCSQDWKRECILGNVSKNSIINIWHSYKYDEARAKVFGEKKSDKNFICKRCKLSLVNIKDAIRLNSKGDRYIDENGIKRIES